MPCNSVLHNQIISYVVYECVLPHPIYTPIHINFWVYFTHPIEHTMFPPLYMVEAEEALRSLCYFAHFCKELSKSSFTSSTAASL
jgi:hypothetical protein